MSNWASWFPWVLGCCLAILVLASTGCVSPESAKRIAALEAKIADAASKHKSGELTTKETEDIIRGALAEIREINDSEKWYNILGAAAIVAVGRFLGIPGLASSSGVNFASFIKGLVTKKE